MTIAMWIASIRIKSAAFPKSWKASSNSVTAALAFSAGNTPYTRRGWKDDSELTSKTFTDSASISIRTTFSTFGLTLPVSFDSTLTPRETIGGVLSTDVVPFGVPQIGLGTVFGTDIMVRWLPQITAPDVGSVELFGFGVRHNLNQYLPVLPFDVSIQAAWQRILVEDHLNAEVMDAHTFAVNMALSKRIGVLTVYGGLQSERSDTDFSYTFDVEDFDDSIEADPVDVNFTVSHKGRTRGIAGFGVKLGPVVWNADVSVGKLVVYSVGLGVAF